MHHFDYRRGRLHAEGVSLTRLAREHGTPSYVYSRATLERHFEAMDAALADHRHLVCYSVKACSNLAVLDVLARQGAGFDVVSAGEIHRVRKAGGDPGKIVFSGVGKREDELELALKIGIKVFNVESEGELSLLGKVARRLGKVAPVSLRVNPDVDPKTHPYISTGLRSHKFGIPLEDARRLYARTRRMKGLRVCGIDCHIGSQLTELAPFVDALEEVKRLVLELRDQGHPIEHIDLGGGLGITYDAEEPPHPREWGQAVGEVLADLPELEVLIEPGRVIAGNAGILLTRVLYVKQQGERRFVIVDAGMNDLARPALYGAYHAILPVRAPAPGAKPEVVDVVGPICESGDFLAQERELPPSKPGDLLAVMSAGAYGFTMSSNYNGRPRAAELLVDGKSVHLARVRETTRDLIRGERRLPPSKESTR